MYEVFLTEHAKANLAELRKFGKPVLQQIKDVLQELQRDPYAMTRELHAPLAGYRSLHAGRFRAVVRIVDKEVRVYVLAVGWHESGSRDDIYQRVQRALRSGTLRPPSNPIDPS